jgi:hypothetical protein
MFANEDLSPPTVCDAPDTPDSPIVPKSRRKPRRFGATTTIPSDGSDDSNRRRGKTTTYRRKVILDDDVDQIPPQLKSSKSKRVLSRPKSKQVATLEAPIHRPPVASPPTSNQSKSEVECVDETDLVEAVVNDEDWKGQRLDALDGPMWTESVVHAFFRRPFRQSGQFGLDPDLVLIKSFKRYGSGARFKFKCAFRHPRTRLCVVQWARYQDLLPNPTYMAKLKSYGFEISVTSKLDCGLKDMKGEEDWSDGVEADEDGTIDFSLDVNTSSQPKRKSRRKFPEFAIGALDEMLNAATSGPDDHLDSDDAVPAIEVADKDL